MRFGTKIMFKWLKLSFSGFCCFWVFYFCYDTDYLEYSSLEIKDTPAQQTVVDAYLVIFN